MIPKCGKRGQPGFSLWKLTTKKELPRKIDGTRLTVAKILHNLLAADHLERLFNNLCSGVGLDDATTLILPSGSASNETLPNPSSCVEALCSSSCRSSTRQNCLCSVVPFTAPPQGRSPLVMFWRSTGGSHCGPRQPGNQEWSSNIPIKQIGGKAPRLLRKGWRNRPPLPCQRARPDQQRNLQRGKLLSPCSEAGVQRTWVSKRQRLGS